MLAPAERDRASSRRVLFSIIAVASLVVPALAGPAGATSAGSARPVPASVAVFATGLANPRGLEFGPDGNLYVAEGGTGGHRSTVGHCHQVDAPAGPYSGGYTARISKIRPNGNRRTVAEGLPSSETSPDLGSLVSGVSDIAFVGSTLYALEAGAGCSHGLAGTSNGVLEVSADGTVRTVANLSRFIKSHPVANPPPDFEPDGTWYSMVAVEGALYAVEPNHGQLIAIQPDVATSRVIDMSASPGHVVPTAVTFYRGAFYVGNLGTFPITPGDARIYKISPSGRISVYAPGLQAVLGVAFDSQGRLYALENTTGNPFPTPNTGDILRWNGSGWDTIASGLNLPTAMTFGPDGRLYVSTCGFGCPTGAGEIDVVTIED